MHCIVTGAAGFIGFHLSQRLLALGHQVYALDNLNPYYEVQLKRDRLALLSAHPNFHFVEGDLAQASTWEAFEEVQPEVIIHLAAQAGVRYSIDNPLAYSDSNLTGFTRILEFARSRDHLKHFIYASSSSVYGRNQKQPFSATDPVDHPVSLYAATKRANELMAHTYAHLYQIPCTGLRFFTVYGPWGRPDMAYFSFAQAIQQGRPIPVFGEGKLMRDFTYIDDVVESMVRLMDHPPQANEAVSGDALRTDTSWAPYRIFNIGNNSPVDLMQFIGCIEKALGKKAQLEFKPMQAGDVPVTWANSSPLYETIGFKPNTPLQTGINAFVEWMKMYYR